MQGDCDGNLDRPRRSRVRRERRPPAATRRLPRPPRPPPAARRATLVAAVQRVRHARERKVLSMIRVNLIRHGFLAVDRSLGAEVLWPQWRTRVRSAAAFAGLRESVGYSFTTPLRAVAPAGRDELSVLGPPRPAAAVARLPGKRVADDEGVALAGHEPQPSGFATRPGELAAPALWPRKGDLAGAAVEPPAAVRGRCWLQPAAVNLQPAAATPPPTAPLRRAG